MTKSITDFFCSSSPHLRVEVLELINFTITLDHAAKILRCHPFVFASTIKLMEHNDHTQNQK